MVINIICRLANALLTDYLINRKFSFMPLALFVSESSRVGCVLFCSRFARQHMIPKSDAV